MGETDGSAGAPSSVYAGGLGHAFQVSKTRLIGRCDGSGAVDFDYTAKDWPQIPEMPRNLQVLHAGFNAFAAAQVYYHRPGDWKEQPNFFNPLWGARLMPVMESNVVAKLGFDNVPLMKQFLLH